LERYGSLDYLFKLDIEDALPFIDYAYEKREEELIFQRWIPYQQISYDEFKAQIKPPVIKNDEEILKDVKEIINAFNKGVERNGNI